MRICSFVPAGTEILFVLGLGEQVVGVSHECDYPPAARNRPKLTTATIDSATMSNVEIDRAVSRALSEGRATYRVDMDTLRALRPDLIVTQDLCAVCGVDGSEVRRAASQLRPVPRVLSIEPNQLPDILEVIRAIGSEVGVSPRADELVADLTVRIEAARRATRGMNRPRVLCLEWLDPPWVAGHWMPDVVEVAGGVDVLGRAGKPSRRVSWEEIVEAQPEVAILMPCGFDVERALAEAEVLETVPHIGRIPAFRSGDVYAVDASSYFSRGGPRLVDGIELLADVLHPKRLRGASPGLAARRLPRLLANGAPARS